jgi:predicted transcriptional regulator
MAGSITAPTSFRRSKKSSPSGRRTHFSILGGITDRDTQILLQLYEHKVLTTEQIYELHFSSLPRARKRLSQLYERGLLDRFRPPKRPGSYPHHYVLDDLGAKVVAGYLGVELKELRFRKDRLLGLSKSPFLRHLRDTNGFFSRLAHECGQAGDGIRLSLWLGERRGRLFAIRPDGLGRVSSPDGDVSFWLELDRGTETHERLEDKMYKYARSAVGPEDLPHAVLFCFHSKDRESRARRALLDLEHFVVATATLGRHRAEPLGGIWLPVRGERRFPLLGLPVPTRTGLSFDAEHDLVPPNDDVDYRGWW